MVFNLQETGRKILNRDLDGAKFGKKVISGVLATSLLFFSNVGFCALDNSTQIDNPKNMQETNVSANKKSFYQNAKVKLEELCYKGADWALTNPVYAALGTFGVIVSGSFIAGFVQSGREERQKLERDGWNALHYAAADGDVNKFMEIYEENPEFLNQKDSKGRTPLDIWLMYGNYDYANDVCKMKDISQSWLSALLLDESIVTKVLTKEQWYTAKNQLSDQLPDMYKEYCRREYEKSKELSYDDWYTQYKRHIMSFNDWKADPQNKSLDEFYGIYFESCKKTHAVSKSKNEWLENKYNDYLHRECDGFKKYSYEQWFDKFKNDPKIIVSFEQFKMLSDQNEFGETYEEYKTNYDKWVQTYRRIKNNYDQIKALMKDAILRNDELGFELLCKRFENASWCMCADAGFERELVYKATDDKGIAHERSVRSKYIPLMNEFLGYVREHTNNEDELRKIFNL